MNALLNCSADKEDCFAFIDQSSSAPCCEPLIERQENRPGEYKPKANLVTSTRTAGQSNLDKIQRLAAIADSIEPRPVSRRKIGSGKAGHCRPKILLTRLLSFREPFDTDAPTTLSMISHGT